MKKILLIDDSPLERVGPKNSLEKEGFEIFEAECGKDAIELAMQKEFDLLIIDYHMPEMKGTEVLATLRKDSRYSNKPALIYTSDNSLEIKKASKSLGAIWIGKPMDASGLIRAVKKLLQS